MIRLTRNQRSPAPLSHPKAWHGLSGNMAISSGSWQGGISQLISWSFKVGRNGSLRSCPDHPKTPLDTSAQGGPGHSHFEAIWRQAGPHRKATVTSKRALTAGSNRAPGLVSRAISDQVRAYSMPRGDRASLPRSGLRPVPCALVLAISPSSRRRPRYLRLALDGPFPVSFGAKLVRARIRIRAEPSTKDINAE